MKNVHGEEKRFDYRVNQEVDVAQRRLEEADHLFSERVKLQLGYFGPPLFSDGLYT